MGTIYLAIQSRYLVDYIIDLSYISFISILLLNLIGFYIFRMSNSQNLFRTNPNDNKVLHLKTLSTTRGTKLIISGWWGISRHINYFGDWLMTNQVINISLDLTVLYHIFILFILLFYLYIVKEEMNINVN